MTNDELQEHIRAIEGALASGEIQERFHGREWRKPSDGYVEIGAGEFHYRIKPKPREFVLAPIGTGPKDARHYADVSNITGNFENTIRVREIVDE